MALRRCVSHLAPLAEQWVAAACVTLASAPHLTHMQQQRTLDPGTQAYYERVASHYTASPSAQQHEHGAACADGTCGHSDHPKQPQTFEEQEHTCWSCHDKYNRGGFVCRSCDRIQPVDSSLTYFDLMGYNHPTFDLDPAALEKRYKLLQWQLHPDKSAGKTPEERQYSADQATLINQAYGVLRNPLARANYMLLLSGMSETEFEHTIGDPELLMEVMEAREQVDQEEDQQQLVKLHAANKQRQAALCAELAEAFKADNIELAGQLVAQLSYWARLEEAICNKL